MVLENLTLQWGNTQVRYKADAAPPDEVYYWLLPDDLLPAMYRKARPNESQGFPQTVNVTTATETIPMTERIQRFLYALNPGLPTNAFADTYDTWNKGTKIRDSANFIHGDNLSAGLPKYPCDLLFGCNVIKAKRIFKWEGGSGVNVGVEMIEIETINPDMIPFIDPATLPPHLKQHLTIIHPAIYNGRKRVNPFPQNGGRNGKPCYTALLARSPLYIEAARCERVNYIPNVYNPT